MGVNGCHGMHMVNAIHAPHGGAVPENFSMYIASHLHLKFLNS